MKTKMLFLAIFSSTQCCRCQQRLEMTCNLRVEVASDSGKPLPGARVLVSKDVLVPQSPYPATNQVRVDALTDNQGIASTALDSVHAPEGAAISLDGYYVTTVAAAWEAPRGSDGKTRSAVIKAVRKPIKNPNAMHAGSMIGEPRRYIRIPVIDWEYGYDLLLCKPLPPLGDGLLRRTVIVGLGTVAICTRPLSQNVSPALGLTMHVGDQVVATRPAEEASHQLETLTPEEILDQRNRGVSAFDTKVRFWGKVVDQDGKPVEGAVIKAIVATLRMIKVEGGYREYEILSTSSAADGSFMLDGAEGFSLTIRQLSKDGHVLPSAYQAGTRWQGARYDYDYKSIGNLAPVFLPDPSRPVVFHLWKLKHPEPLVINGNKSGFDGPEFQIGGPQVALTMSGLPEYLLNKLGLERDITVKVSEVGNTHEREWEVTVTAVESDGGVVKASKTDPFLFIAPESGYHHSVSFRYGLEGADAVKAEPGAPVRFFVRSQGGHWHSAVDFAFFAPDPNGTVMTKKRLWMNPSGSRNLEHDGAHPIDRPTLRR